MRLIRVILFGLISLTMGQEYNKTYTGEEVQERIINIINNMKSINDDDSKTLGINKFFNLSRVEFKNIYKSGYLYDNFNKEKSSCKTFKSSNMEIPESIDWRDKLVTDVKDQGKCGSCWSFSATGALEGAWAKKSGSLISLSEQQLIDCSLAYGNLACHGGLMDNAFEYAIEHGMCKESQEPYNASLETCKECDSVAYFSDCYDIPSGNQLLLKEAVAYSPVSVAIEADAAVFQLYTGGIISSDKCGTNLDHGVLIVGYGQEKKEKYWLVKNSWGEDWGENGYLRIKRTESENDVGICGIAMQASQPEATKIM